MNNKPKIKALSGIYILCWEDNSYFYIGQSANLWNRRGQHFRHLKNGTHDNQRLQRVFNKYGLPEFQFFELCPVSQMNKIEQSLLDRFLHWPDCLNISPAVDSTRGWKRTDESRKRISDAKTGKKASDEARKNISIALRRSYENGTRKPPQRFGKDNSYFGKKHSEEIRMKMRKSKNVGASNSTARLVLNLETGIYYDYAGEAAHTANINPQYLRRVLNGDRKNRTSFIYA